MENIPEFMEDHNGSKEHGYFIPKMDEKLRPSYGDGGPVIANPLPPEELIKTLRQLSENQAKRLREAGL